MSYVHIEYLIFGTIKVLSVCDMKQHEPAFQRASKSKLDNFVSALLCAVAFMGVPTGHSTTGATFAWAVGSLGQPQFGWVWDSLRAVVNCGHKVLGGCGLKTWNNFCFLAYFFCTRFFFLWRRLPQRPRRFWPNGSFICGVVEVNQRMCWTPRKKRCWERHREVGGCGMGIGVTTYIQ